MVAGQDFAVGDVVLGRRSEKVGPSAQQPCIAARCREKQTAFVEASKLWSILGCELAGHSTLVGIVFYSRLIANSRFPSSVDRLQYEPKQFEGHQHNLAVEQFNGRRRHR